MSDPATQQSSIYYTIFGTDISNAVEKDSCSNVIKLCEIHFERHTVLKSVKVGDLKLYKPGTTDFSVKNQLDDNGLNGTAKDRRIIVKVFSTG
jgi:hypothetical protein